MDKKIFIIHWLEPNIVKKSLFEFNNIFYSLNSPWRAQAHSPPHMLNDSMGSTLKIITEHESLFLIYISVKPLVYRKIED